MVSGVDSSLYQQMYAAGASSSGASIAGGQQQFQPQDSNIWKTDGDDYSIGALSSSRAGTQSPVTSVGSIGENYGLVSRLDNLDSKTLTPTYQDGEHKLDLYA